MVFYGPNGHNFHKGFLWAGGGFCAQLRSHPEQMLLVVPLAVFSLLVLQNSENPCSRHFWEWFRKCVCCFGAKMGKAILFPTASLNSRDSQPLTGRELRQIKGRLCPRATAGYKTLFCLSFFQKKQDKLAKQGVGQGSCAISTLQLLVLSKPAWIPLCSSVLCCIHAFLQSAAMVPASTAAS